MTDSTETVRLSYAACRQISRRARSSFYAGFFLLPGKKRHAMEALYAFARVTDDIADGPAPLPERRERLAAWRKALEHTLSSTGRENVLSGKAPAAVRAGSTDRFFILPALADTIERFSIPQECFWAMVDGAAMDLDRNRYETFDALEIYCRRVASAVGRACVHIWGYHGVDVFEPADKCGIAMQLTNILRDVKEDLARNRVYLPQDELRLCHYTESDLRGGIADARFRRLMNAQIERAERYYREGLPVLNWLESDGRRMCGMIMDRYRTLLAIIGRQPAVVLRRRVRLAAPAKARLMIRWLLWNRPRYPTDDILT